MWYSPKNKLSKLTSNLNNIYGKFATPPSLHVPDISAYPYLKLGTSSGCPVCGFTVFGQTVGGEYFREKTVTVTVSKTLYGVCEIHADCLQVARNKIREGEIIT